MPLTKEQLIQKRFKFIMPYPGSHWEVGDIFEHINNDIYVVSHYPVKMLGVILETYPHIFQPLPWWSDRKPEDMPEYVKEVDSLYKIGEVVKVKEWVLENEETDCPCFQDERDNHFTWIRGFEPATESEYNAYINQKQQ